MLAFILAADFDEVSAAGEVIVDRLKPLFDFLDDVDQRINSRVLRGALFSAVREVAGVDDDVTAEEGSLLAAVAVRFD